MHFFTSRHYFRLARKHYTDIFSCHNAIEFHLPATSETMVIIFRYIVRLMGVVIISERMTKYSLSHS